MKAWQINLFFTTICFTILFLTEIVLKYVVFQQKLVFFLEAFYMLL